MGARTSEAVDNMAGGGAMVARAINSVFQWLANDVATENDALLIEKEANKVAEAQG